MVDSSSGTKASATQDDDSSLSEPKSAAAWTLSYILDGSTFDDAPSESVALSETTGEMVAESEKGKDDTTEVILEIREETDVEEICDDKKEVPIREADLPQPSEDRNSDEDDGEDDFVDAEDVINTDSVDASPEDGPTTEDTPESGPNGQETDCEPTVTDSTPEAEQSSISVESSGTIPDQADDPESKPALEEEKETQADEKTSGNDPESDAENESKPWMVGRSQVEMRMSLVMWHDDKHEGLT